MCVEGDVSCVLRVMCHVCEGDVSCVLRVMCHVC